MASAENNEGRDLPMPLTPERIISGPLTVSELRDHYRHFAEGGYPSDGSVATLARMVLDLLRVVEAVAEMDGPFGLQDGEGWYSCPFCDKEGRTFPTKATEKIQHEDSCTYRLARRLTGGAP